MAPFQMQLFRLSFVILLFSGVYSVNFPIKNNCPYPIWPGVLTGYEDKFSTTGFELPSGSVIAVKVSPPWSGRFWARTNCLLDDSGNLTCSDDQATSKGAIPPTSVVDIHLGVKGNLDFFDISLVHGFNLPVSVVPVGGSDKCPTITCARNVNSVCPPELALKGQDGKVIACKSACMVFNTPEFCCTGAHNDPKTCKPTKYSKIFKDQCPQAYSYKFDDTATSLFECLGGPDYAITFCP